MKQIIFIFAASFLIISCGSNDNNAAQQLQAQQKTMDSLQTEMVKKQTIDSMNAVVAQNAPVNNEQQANETHHHYASRPTTNNYTTNNTTTNSGYAVPAAVVPPEPQKKKGWSDKAKGAVIGVGAGAITGAMVDKKRGQGAIIGGVIGGAAGLGAGAIMDNKNKDR